MQRTAVMILFRNISTVDNVICLLSLRPFLIELDWEYIGFSAVLIIASSKYVQNRDHEQKLVSASELGVFSCFASGIIISRKFFLSLIFWFISWLQFICASLTDWLCATFFSSELSSGIWYLNSKYFHPVYKDSNFRALVYAVFTSKTIA